MGWFWADSDPSLVLDASRAPHPIPRDGGSASPPPGCPMHKGGAASPITHPPKSSSRSASASASASASGCPHIPSNHPSSSSPSSPEESTTAAPSKYSKYNPLNYMYNNLSQEKAPDQTIALPTTREPSTIPKGSGDGNWEYPSPQQMYHAMLRKGGGDEIDITAVESMVSVHNYLNEGAWAEIVEWERRFAPGFAHGWQACKRGEMGSQAGAHLAQGANEEEVVQPKLMRFMGRPKDMTPKAALIQMLGRIYPSYFATEPPFDRHDWFVQRSYKGQQREVRYVIDYYSGGEEPNGDPIFYLDVRPALTPTAAVERMMRWGGDVWYRASGGVVREGWSFQ